VATRAFWEVLHRRGGADVYVTEYFRVHPQSYPRELILDSIIRNPTGRPVFAQLIGNSVQRMVETARQLQEYDIAGIDLNLGCPGPKVCGKSCGGALLREPELVRELVLRLRDVVTGNLTVKTRIGYASEAEFPDLLDLFCSLPIQALAIHGRTVKERYHTPVHTREIAAAVAAAPFPVLANGSMVCVDSALAMLSKTGAAGLMMGRGAIRNPWIFEQLRQHFSGDPIFQPRCIDMLEYIEDLFEIILREGRIQNELRHVRYLKKFMSFAVADLFEGEFWNLLRRCHTSNEFLEICRDFLDTPRQLNLETDPESKVFCGVHELMQAPIQKNAPSVE